MANRGQVAMATGLNIGTLSLLPKFYLGFGKTSIKAEGGKANYFIDLLFFCSYRIWTGPVKSENVYLVRRLAFLASLGFWTAHLDWKTLFDFFIDF